MYFSRAYCYIFLCSLVFSRLPAATCLQSFSLIALPAKIKSDALQNNIINFIQLWDHHKRYALQLDKKIESHDPSFIRQHFFWKRIKNYIHLYGVEIFIDYFKKNDRKDLKVDFEFYSRGLSFYQMNKLRDLGEVLPLEIDQIDMMKFQKLRLFLKNYLENYGDFQLVLDYLNAQANIGETWPIAVIKFLDEWPYKKGALEQVHKITPAHHFYKIWKESNGLVPNIKFRGYNVVDLNARDLDREDVDHEIRFIGLNFQNYLVLRQSNNQLAYREYVKIMKVINRFVLLCSENSWKHLTINQVKYLRFLLQSSMGHPLFFETIRMVAAQRKVEHIDEQLEYFLQAKNLTK